MSIRTIGGLIATIKTVASHTERTDSGASSPRSAGHLSASRMGPGRRRSSEKPRRRLELALDRMAMNLLSLAEYADSEAVQLKATTEAMDRGGLSAKTEVSVELKPYERLLGDLAGVGNISRAQHRALQGRPIIDAELVEPPDEDAPARPAGPPAAVLSEPSAQDAADRLMLDWATPYRHATFYRAVYRPAVLRANRAAEAARNRGAVLPPQLKFHAPRHTYASLMIAAGRPMFEIARFMGHSKPSATETGYAHLLADDHSDAMAALGAMEATTSYGPNVVPLWG